ncbi:MAG: hypothetical protein ACI93R_002463 [Flavobacteriales bacterium]|jgi:hypothetical protein
MNKAVQCFLSLIFCLALVACGAPSKRSGNGQTTSSNVGNLVTLSKSALYFDAAQSQALDNPPSLGLVLKDQPSYRVFLSDGRIAWASAVGDVIPTNIYGRGAAVDVASLPFTESDTPDFSWGELAGDQALTVLGATTERYSQSPHYVRQNGRQLAIENPHMPFFLPQVHLSSGPNSGWASLTDLRFQFADQEFQKEVYGLIQLPFMALSDGNTRDFSQLNGKKYTDFTQQKPRNLVLDVEATSWNIEQLVKPFPSDTLGIHSIALLSQKSNCTIFAVSWTSGEYAYFGYCDYSYGAPTPVISGYKVSVDNFLELNVVEVLGDENRNVVYRVPGFFDRSVPVELKVR